LKIICSECNVIRTSRSGQQWLNLPKPEKPPKRPRESQSLNRTRKISVRCTQYYSLKLNCYLLTRSFHIHQTRAAVNWASFW
jgi:hypothetical protein